MGRGRMEAAVSYKNVFAERLMEYMQPSNRRCRPF
jgi:hypothetical protein